MAGYCKIILIGNLGRDPEIRYTADGLAVANFNIAVNEKIKGEERTQWYRITAFRKLAEICGEYLSKGKQVYIEGKLQANEWTDPEGNKKFFLDVVASEMRMLGTKGDSYNNSRPSSAYETPRPSAGYDEPGTVCRKHTTLCRPQTVCRKRTARRYAGADYGFRPRGR